VKLKARLQQEASELQDQERTPSQLKVRTRVHLVTTQKAQNTNQLKRLHSSGGGGGRQAGVFSQFTRLSSTAVCHWVRGVSRQFGRTNARKIHPSLDTHSPLFVCIPLCIFTLSKCVARRAWVNLCVCAVALCIIYRMRRLPEERAARSNECFPPVAKYNKMRGCGTVSVF
jgi:hypothetical protein